MQMIISAWSFIFCSNFDLCVFVEPGENSHGVLVVNQLAAEFEVKSFTVLVVYAFQNVLGLLFDVLVRDQNLCFIFYHLFFHFKLQIILYLQPSV